MLRPLCFAGSAYLLQTVQGIWAMGRTKIPEILFWEILDTAAKSIYSAENSQNAQSTQLMI